MSLFTKGQEAVETIQKEKVDLKDAYIRLKNENDSLPVRVLDTEDVVVYKAHGDFKKGLYNTPCIAPLGQDCPYCVATNKGGEDWSGFYAKERVMYAFGDLTSGSVKVLEVSKNQAKKISSQIAEYQEEIEAGEIAFNLTRTGSGTSTGYSLNVITPKKMKSYEEKFQAFEGVAVDETFFEERIGQKSPTYMTNLLEGAGFDIDAHLDPVLVAQARQEKANIDNRGTTLATTEAVKPIEDTEEDF